MGNLLALVLAIPPKRNRGEKKDMFQERYGVYNPVKTTVMVLRIGYSYHTVNGVEATTVLGTKWTHSHTIYVKRWKTHVLMGHGSWGNRGYEFRG
jgi:hypothetical protein